ncbi:MAG: hypothetical protein ACP59X_21255 [Solidesulfovibrio sp. DCME]|uniref:hypothetical protein n=1 Tax=Solidesulfovibrio sp. DCME TaxID=3447380 RepID=UPI003D101B44
MSPFFAALAALCLVLTLPSPGQAAGGDFELPLFIAPLTGVPLGRDSDGDGLPDVWELRGYTEGGTFVDLPAMGADPWHKDLFVWMDYMVKPDSTSLAPDQTVIDNIKAVFANAPVDNPDGTKGVTIHPLLKNQVAYKEQLGTKGDDASVWTDFDALKDADTDFNAALARSHRYMIWANDYQQSGSSGLARNIPATDFIVSLGTFPTTGGTSWEKLGTFIHELGHCLGLKHGGTDDTNYKPNYLSIMSYTFQMTGLYKDGHFGDAGHPLLFDYQRQDTPALNETDLNETLGLTGAGSVAGYGTVFYYYANQTCRQVNINDANAAIDWNQDGKIEAGVSFGIHCDPDEPAEEDKTTLAAQNNWENINYSADGLIGPGLTKAERKTRQAAPIPESLRHELDRETYRKLQQARQSATP